jgi:hypothetical protein
VWNPRQLLWLSALYLLLAVPFFFAASCFGLAFARHGQRIPLLYGADLLGAGVGALAALALAYLPVERGLVLAELCGPGAAVLVMRPRGIAFAAVAAAAVVAAALLLAVAAGPCADAATERVQGPEPDLAAARRPDPGAALGSLWLAGGARQSARAAAPGTGPESCSSPTNRRRSWASTPTATRCR